MILLLIYHSVEKNVRVLFFLMKKHKQMSTQGEGLVQLNIVYLTVVFKQLIFPQK